MIKNDQQYLEVKEQWQKLEEELSELFKVESSLRDMEYDLYRDDLKSRMDILIQQMHDYEAIFCAPLQLTLTHIITGVNHIFKLSKHPWHPLYTVQFTNIYDEPVFSLLISKEKLQDIHDLIERTLEMKNVGE